MWAQVNLGKLNKPTMTYFEQNSLKGLINRIKQEIADPFPNLAANPSCGS